MMNTLKCQVIKFGLLIEYDMVAEFHAAAVTVETRYLLVFDFDD